MEKEFKCGRMDRYTKDIGLEIKHVGMEDLFMQMEMSTMEIGKIINHMATEFTSTKMAQSMRATGKRTCSMEMVMTIQKYS